VRLRDAMQAHGLAVSFTRFERVHQVTEQVSMEVAAFIRRCAGSR
jgi:predicted esterase